MKVLTFDDYRVFFPGGSKEVKGVLLADEALLYLHEGMSYQTWSLDTGLEYRIGFHDKEIRSADSHSAVPALVRVIQAMVRGEEASDFFMDTQVPELKRLKRRKLGGYAVGRIDDVNVPNPVAETEEAVEFANSHNLTLSRALWAVQERGVIRKQI